MSHDPQRVLRNLKPEKKFFIGIDSDGCAFDTMEIKHKECFIPNIVKHWGLQPVSRYAREAAEFVNLYSRWRGLNRFPALVKVFELLKDWDEPMRRNPEVPDVSSLEKWIEEESRLGNPALEEKVRQTGDPVLEKALLWSKDVNAAVADIVENVPPFPFMRESLDKVSEFADVMVVSSTPLEALEREWKEHGIADYCRVIAGQEHGSKKEHLALAAKGKYDDDKILMIGDAPGDMKAAKANDVLFYPINPGSEDKSWKRFLNETLDKFKTGTYSGEYEDRVIAEFDEYLPEIPPWKK